MAKRTFREMLDELRYLAQRLGGRLDAVEHTVAEIKLARARSRWWKLKVLKVVGCALAGALLVLWAVVAIFRPGVAMPEGLIVGTVLGMVGFAVAGGAIGSHL